MSRLLSTAVNHVATSPERSATRVRFLKVITAAVDAQTLEYVRALRAGYSSRLLTSDGGVTGNPADFLIDASGRVVFAQYGKHYADSLEACDVVNAWRSAHRRAPAPNVALQLSTLAS
jgi:hypothetical protein